MKSTDKTLLLLAAAFSMGWGFFGHETINRLSIFSLPPEMIGFYKLNMDYLVEASVNPDKRRYAVKEEAPRHYIDLDSYGDSAKALPLRWHEAVARCGEDSLMKHGIVPWYIPQMVNRLQRAFFMNDPEAILRYSAELGHYVADANVPLHTTRNHNGQLTNQHGIHGFWESRLPELYAGRYDFLVGKADYVGDVPQRAWAAVHRAHRAVDSVLNEERKLAESHPHKRFNYETRGRQTVRVYSASYAHGYHERLSGMVERQMRASVKMTADLWYTAWVDAGQPDLRRLLSYRPTEEELQRRRQEWDAWKARSYPVRDHEDGVK